MGLWKIRSLTLSYINPSHKEDNTTTDTDKNKERGKKIDKAIMLTNPKKLKTKQQIDSRHKQFTDNLASPKVHPGRLPNL